MVDELPWLGNEEVQKCREYHASDQAQMQEPEQRFRSNWIEHGTETGLQPGNCGEDSHNQPQISPSVIAANDFVSFTKSWFYFTDVLEKDLPSRQYSTTEDSVDSHSDGE